MKWTGKQTRHTVLMTYVRMYMRYADTTDDTKHTTVAAVVR